MGTLQENLMSYKLTTFAQIDGVLSLVEEIFFIDAW